MAGFVPILAVVIGNLDKFKPFLQEPTVGRMVATPWILALLALGLTFMSHAFGSETLRRGGLAGSLIALFLIFPVFHLFLPAANNSPEGLPGLGPTGWACLAGAALTFVAWIRKRGGTPGEAFLGGFLCGGIPLAMLGTPLLDSQAVPLGLEGIFASNAPRIGENMTALMKMSTRLFLGNGAIVFLPLLVGIVGSLRSDPSPSRPSGQVEGGNKIHPARVLLLAFLASGISLVEVTVIAAMEPTSRSFRSGFFSLGLVHELPISVLLGLSVLPIIVLGALIWTVFFDFGPRLEKIGRSVGSIIPSTFILAGIAPFVFPNPTFKAFLVTQVLLGLLFLVPLRRSSKSRESLSGAPDLTWETSLTEFTFFGGVGLTTVIVPIFNLALVTGLTSVPMIAYCFQEIPDKTVQQLREMIAWTDIWPILSMAVALVFLGSAVAGFMAFTIQTSLGHFGKVPEPLPGSPETR